MSWISQNYHKVLFGAAVVIAAGLAYSAYSSSKNLEEQFILNSRPKNKDTAVPGLQQAEDIIKSAQSSTALEQQKLGDRPVDLFTSVGLVVRKGAPTQALDLKKEASIHAPIPNQWWIDNGIDPGWGDAPQRDQDGDGFSNLEEFTAKTSPTNPAEFPSLVNKLQVASVEKFSWRPLFNSILGDGKYQFRYEDSKGQDNRIKAGDEVAVGDIFFKEGAAKGRLKLVKIESRQEDSSTGMKDRDYAILEDQIPSKKGKTYEVPYRLTNVEKREQRNVYHDYTVVFTLEAIGEEGKEFKVIENESFSLPVGAKEKGYKLVEVKADKKGEATSVVVEHQQAGETKKIELPVPSK